MEMNEGTSNHKDVEELMRVKLEGEKKATVTRPANCPMHSANACKTIQIQGRARIPIEDLSSPESEASSHKRNTGTAT